MRRHWAIGFGIAFLVVKAGSGQEASGVIAAAVKAIGADSLRTVEYSGSGYDFALGQSYASDFISSAQRTGLASAG